MDHRYLKTAFFLSLKHGKVIVRSCIVSLEKFKKQLNLSKKDAKGMELTVCIREVSLVEFSWRRTSEIPPEPANN